MLLKFRTFIMVFKKTIIIISGICFCAAFGFAQTRTKHKTDWLAVNNNLFLPACFSLKPLPAPQLKNMLCVKTELPKLPFFCSMEDKFRNKFKVFLKLRAGTDDWYMSVIRSDHR